jgi:3-oxoacyl-[acyl-carrier-protein] synthase III
VTVLHGREVVIAGLGSYSPGDPVPFDDIEKVLGTITKAPPKLLRWIDRMRPIMKEMLGMDQYFYALDPETREPTDDNVTMGAKAARKALDSAGMKAADVDLLVYAGIMMENICPPTSVLVQEELKIPHCADLSIHSNCTCVYKALQVASDLIANGRYRNALIVTSQLSSPFLRSEYFNQEVMEKPDVLLRWFLCDGAGAMVLAPPEKDRRGHLRVVDTYIESVGLGMGPDMYCSVGGHRTNAQMVYEKGLHHLRQNFDQVMKVAPKLGLEALDHMVDKTGLDLSKVKYFLANIPTRHLYDIVTEDLSEGRKLKNIKFYSKLSEHGYPGPCAIIIALDNFTAETPLAEGDIVISMVTESSKWMHGGFILEYSTGSSPPVRAAGEESA